MEGLGQELGLQEEGRRGWGWGWRLQLPRSAEHGH